MHSYAQVTINRPKSPGRRRRTSQHSEEAQPSEPLFLNLLLPQCDSSGKSKPSNAPLVYYAELPRTAASYAHRIQRRKSPCHTTSEAEENLIFAQFSTQRNETENANVGCVTVKSECGQLSISYNAGAVQETGAPQVSAQTALPTVTCTPVCPLPMVCAPLCYYEVPQQTMMTMMTPLPPPTLMPPTPSPSPFYRSASRRKSRRARSSSRRGRSKSRKRQLPYTLSLALHGEPGTVASTQTEAQFEPPSLYRRPTFISPKPSVSPKWPAESPPTRPIVQHKIVYQKTVPCMEDNYCVPCVPGVYTELSSDEEDQLELQARRTQSQASAQGYEDVAEFKDDAKFGRIVRKQVYCCPAMCYCNDCYAYDSANDYCSSSCRRLRRLQPICVNRRSRAEKVLIPVELCQECEERQTSGKPGPTKILISRS